MHSGKNQCKVARDKIKHQNFKETCENLINTNDLSNIKTDVAMEDVGVIVPETLMP